MSIYRMAALKQKNIMSNINKYPRASEQKIPRDVPQAIYQMLMETSPICTIDILFFNPEKTHTLLGRRTNEPYKNTFYAFGGRLRKNETFEEAAIRIAEKETGIKIAPEDIRFAGILNEINGNSLFDGTNYHAVDLYFACVVPLDVRVDLDSQHGEYQWFNVSDEDLYPNIKTRIKNSLKVLK